MAKYNYTKIENLHIPVPNFEFHHTPSSEDGVDKKFIGRKKELSQLQEWIKKGDSGNYLITGHRGMGKTSFVGKALNEIQEKPEKLTKYDICARILPLAVFFFLSYFAIYCFEITICRLVIGVLVSFVIIGIIGLFYKYQEQKKNKQKETKKQNYIIAKINLGHEILNERDILSLIATNIYEKYEKYLHSFGARGWLTKSLIIAKYITFCILSAFCLYCLIHLVAAKFPFSSLRPIIDSEDLTFLSSIYYFIAGVKNFIESNEIWLPFLFNFLIYIGLFFLIKYLWSKIGSLFYVFRANSKIKLLSDLGKLINRVNAVVSEDSGPNATANVNPIIGINLFRRKSKQYPLASVRELESELLSILNRINTPTLGTKKERENAIPKIVIVFDELDKIDPEYNYETAKEQEQPEFEKSNTSFSGGMASRGRKQNVLKLLGNMKLFISSAKAKFIFISGRELYDAYLADLSDREFAVSSIFNGVIYVDSFFESNEASKNISSKTEEYICYQLFPEEYIKGEGGKENWEKEKKYNFKEYYKFLKFVAQKEKDASDEIGYPDKYIIEKIIFFLSQFAVYLSHISNGSPKKIALYFEKYITKFGDEKTNYTEKEPNKIIEFYEQNKYLKSDDYCLSFNIPEQRSIGFVHYMVYPVVQATINRSSQFNDKLLVSASFLIDHILKHHIGGFSRDNIEHIPELMEVYRTPELRHFINTIIAFMRQSHIVPISTGLYHYKFRKSISDEIRYYSKISEEVSAIFNFTLDEALPIKKYYSKKIEYYNHHYLQFQQNQNQNFIQINPYVISLVQMCEILAELQLLDEELDEAIANFQNGLQLLKNELFFMEKQEFVEQNHMHLIILLIKNILKLGLTLETQRTHNAAYALYCELMNYLLHFRNVDEAKDLGLDYARQLSDDSYKTYQPVFFYHSYSSFRNHNRDKDFHKNILPHNYEDIEDKDKIKYQVIGDTILPQLANPLMPKKHNIITKLTMFDDVRFIYQVILAKLFVVEKIDLTGITQTNLDIAEAEFNYMNLFSNSKDKFILAADFYRKLGAIMFIKNDNTVDTRIILKYWGADLTELIERYCKTTNDKKAKQKLYNYFKENHLYKIGEGEEKEEPISKLDELIRKLKGSENDNDVVKRFADFLTTDASSKQIVEKINEKVNYNRCITCNKHSHQLWQKQHFIPCYSCNYYSKSLNILKTMLPDNLFNQKEARVFGFLRAINRIEIRQLDNIRVSNLLIIADTLRGFADVHLSCSDKEHFEEEEKKEREKGGKKSQFNELFSKMLEAEEKNEEKNEIYEELARNYRSHRRLEKSILYYYTAAKYYRKAGSLSDSIECIKKFLQIFITYIKLNKKKCFFTDEGLGFIKKYIVEKSIAHLHATTGHINLSEIQNQKWMLEKQWNETIVLNHLSNYANIQTLIFLYYEFVLANGSYDIEKDNYDKFTESIALSSYRIENTVTQRINLLIFKAQENKRKLYEWLSNFDKSGSDKPGLEKSFIYEPDIYQQFADKLINSYNKGFKDFALLLDIVIDSIYCLIQVAEILYSSKLNKYSNSFIADNYREIFEWTSIYGVIRVLWAGKAEFEKVAKRTIYRREENEKKIEEYTKTLTDFCNINSKILEELKKEKDVDESLLNVIGEGFRHFLAPNYSAEMAVRYYRKAIEANSGGQTYKYIISDMFLLDDDINNPDLTFALALERYRLNSGDIEEKIKNLRDCYKKATYFELEGYFNPKDS